MLVYIKPLSIFPEIHSDTLFGAICHAISELYPEMIENMISDFKENPPFILSSAFPFIFNEDQKIKFFPKIIVKDSSENSYDINVFKEYKEINFIQEDIFFKLASGELKEKNILNNFEDYHFSDDLLMDNNYDINAKHSEMIIPNNSINRITNETEGIFYTSGKKFKNLGLFFLIEFNESKYENIVKGAIRFLRDRGFGRDISTGKGQFDFEIEEYELPSFGGEYFINLSRFIPTNEDLKRINNYASYEIDSKRGRSSAGEIRKQVRFFKEGSVFPHYKESYGKIVESGKDSPAVEYGYAFPFRYNMGDD